MPAEETKGVGENVIECESDDRSIDAIGTPRCSFHSRGSPPSPWTNVKPLITTHRHPNHHNFKLRRRTRRHRT